MSHVFIHDLENEGFYGKLIYLEISNYKFFCGFFKVILILIQSKPYYLMNQMIRN